MAIDDDTQWTVIAARFQDPLDFIEPFAAEEPFIQMLLEQRAQIRRTYSEIQASVPACLTPRERDEYVAARVMQAIASGPANPVGLRDYLVDLSEGGES